MAISWKIPTSILVFIILVMTSIALIDYSKRPFGYISHTITRNALDAVEVFAIDLDGDGDIDVLSASAQDNKIAWYENNGD